jgi:hypothetical protein
MVAGVTWPPRVLVGDGLGENLPEGVVGPSGLYPAGDDPRACEKEGELDTQHSWDMTEV